MIASLYRHHIVVVGVGKVGYRVLMGLLALREAVVAVEEDAEIEAEWPGVIQTKLDAVDRSGKTYHIHIRNPRGHELNPLSPADIETKFLRLTEPALGRDRAATAFKTAWRTKEAASFASVLEKFELAP